MVLSWDSILSGMPVTSAPKPATGLTEATKRRDEQARACLRKKRPRRCRRRAAAMRTCLSRAGRRAAGARHAPPCRASMPRMQPASRGRTTASPPTLLERLKAVALEVDKITVLWVAMVQCNSVETTVSTSATARATMRADSACLRCRPQTVISSRYTDRDSPHPSWAHLPSMQRNGCM